MPKALYSYLTIEPTAEEQLVLLESNKQIVFSYPHLKWAKFKNVRPPEAPYLAEYVKYLSNPNKDGADKIMQIQADLYGSINNDLFWGAIDSILSKVERCKNGEYKDQAAAVLATWPRKIPLKSLYSPDEKAFRHYKDMFIQLYASLIAELDVAYKNHASLKELFDVGLAWAGLDKKGWRCVQAQKRSNALISCSKKIIIVPTNMSLRKKIRIKQLIIHELTHALRAEAGITDYKDVEEGLCIVNEQLVLKNFGHKRLFRYVAIGLGLGLDGKSRDFKEVYQMLWPAMQMMSNVSTSTAKIRAIREARRVFRGGDPNVKGFVFLKDKAYLEENIACWKILSEKALPLSEFKRIIGL